MDTLELQGKKPPSPPLIIHTLSSNYGWTLTEIKELQIGELLTYYNLIQEQRRLENKQYKK